MRTDAESMGEVSDMYAIPNSPSDVDAQRTSTELELRMAQLLTSNTALGEDAATHEKF